MAKLRAVALLRGINVGGHNKVPMAELRSLCEGLGFQEVETYIQSGNVVFSTDRSQAAAEKSLEEAIEEAFGLSVPVVVRSGAQWSRFLKANPFPKESENEPNLVMIALAKKKLKPGAAEDLREYAGEKESIERVGETLWACFGAGSARSKISPARLDRAAGSPVTTRNWRTALRIEEMLRG